MSELYEPFRSELIKAYQASTCQKRVTVCVILDASWNVLAIGSNRCEPEGGVCHRLGVTQDKSNYDVNSNCNWTHAEVNAIHQYKIKRVNGMTTRPYESVLYGHDFFCQPCEDALREIGIEKFTVSDFDIKTLII